MWRAPPGDVHGQSAAGTLAQRGARAKTASHPPREALDSHDGVLRYMDPCQRLPSRRASLWAATMAAGGRACFGSGERLQRKSGFCLMAEAGTPSRPDHRHQSDPPARARPDREPGDGASARSGAVARRGGTHGVLWGSAPVDLRSGGRPRYGRRSACAEGWPPRARSGSTATEHARLCRRSAQERPGHGHGEQARPPPRGHRRV